MRIREACVADTAAIAKVHVDTWRTTYIGLVPDSFLATRSYERSGQIWRRLIEQEPSRFAYVAEDSLGTVIGFAGGGPERTGDPVYRGEVYGIYILEAHQRRGIGRRLIQAAAGRLLREGMDSLLIWVLATNPARAFYEALGGEVVRDQIVTIGGTDLTEVAYGWRDIRTLNPETPDNLA